MQSSVDHHGYSYFDSVPGEIIAMASHSSPDSIAALKASVREILQVQ